MTIDIDISTLTLLNVLRRRLAVIEHDHTERHCLEVLDPLEDGLFEKLSELLSAARMWQKEPHSTPHTPGVERLYRVLNDLEIIKLPHADICVEDGCLYCADPDSDDDYDEITSLGENYVLAHRRLRELQSLYRTRLEVTREALKTKDAELRAVHAATNPLPHSEDPAAR